MKGFIKQSAAVLCFGAAIFSFVGCYHYRELVDPCWPERYNGMARQSVREIHNAQADKGHILDQTVWNWHFKVTEAGVATDELNPAGLEHLRYISRRLPAPDIQLFLQNAQDIPYDAKGDAQKIVKARNDLNNKRIASIKRFMSTQTAVLGDATYQVTVHDFTPPGINATPIIGGAGVPGAIPSLEKNFKGVLPASTGTTGGTGASGSGGGGSTGGM
jgi:hypothetical protein